MHEIRFQPSHLNSVQLLKEKFFTGKKELEVVESLPSSVYMNPGPSYFYSTINACWIVSTLPLRLIYIVFLRSMSSLLSCAYFSKTANSISFVAHSAENDIESPFKQLYWGSKRLVPSFNSYSSKARYITDFEAIQRENLKSPIIRKNLTKLLDRVEFNLGGKGLCHGSVNWFNYLVLLGLDKNISLIEKCDNFKQYFTAISQGFKDGQPIQAALLQSLYGIDCLLLGLEEITLKIESKYHKTRKTLVEKLEALPKGLYHIQIPGVHSMSLLKADDELLLFDPNPGLIELNSLDELAAILEDYSQTLENKPIFFNYQKLDKPNIFERIKRVLWSRMFS